LWVPSNTNQSPYWLILEASSSFISALVAALLSGVLPLATSVIVQVAGGSTRSCEAVIPQALWFINVIAFQSDLRVLPLMAYDIIIGMDWLESFSPMRVHWKQKWPEFPYEGSTLTLQGVVPTLLDEVLVQLCVLSPDSVCSSEVKLLPAEIQLLVDQFSVLFQEPDDQLMDELGCILVFETGLAFGIPSNPA
jgi:hypothetical protein